MSYYALFDDPLAEDISLDYWFDEQFQGLKAPEEGYANFGYIVDTTFIFSEAQDGRRKYGFSEILYKDRPTVYHAGDVVNLPYRDTELSTMEAVGLAWAATISGVNPE